MSIAELGLMHISQVGRAYQGRLGLEQTGICWQIFE
jgi:hypothetical protein